MRVHWYVDPTGSVEPIEENKEDALYMALLCMGNLFDDAWLADCDRDGIMEEYKEMWEAM